MNDQNLIPGNKRSQSELRENGKKGGIRSGEVRREKRMLADTAQMLLGLPLTDAKGIGKLKSMGISKGDMTNAMMMTAAILKRAQSGDTSAYNAIRDIIGEKPKDAVEVSTNDETMRAYENAAKAIRGS